jgi:hypothetical protein
MDLLLGDHNGIVSLPVSKGRTRHNNKESVTITEPALLALLHELVLYKRESRLYKVPIWVHTGTAFRKALYELFKFFGVEHLQFRGYSLRRGGATAFYARTGNMEQTLLRGRWASVSVARLYLCDALSQLPGLVASKRTKELVVSYRAFWST